MDEMGHEPDSSLERDSISPDADIFLLTHDNIKALKLLLSQVIHLKCLITNKSKFIYSYELINGNLCGEKCGLK